MAKHRSKGPRMNRLALVVFTSALALSACNTQPAGNTAQAQDHKASGVDLAGIDKSVAPGDDFDYYANGTWYKTAVIPADRSSVGTGYFVDQLAEKRLAELIHSIANSNPAAGSDDARIANYYSAYTNTNAIEQRGTAPVKPVLDRIAAIQNKQQLAQAIGATVRADVDPLNATDLQTENLFGIFVTQALSDPTRTVPYLLQGGIGLPERDYYVSSEPETAKIRAAYTPYVAKILTLAGFPDAQARAERIVALETKIATAQQSIEQMEDTFHANNPWKPADFAANAPGLDWNSFFNAAQLSSQNEIIVWQPETVKKLAALVASEPLDVWKDWLAFHQVNQMADVLPSAFDQAHFAFYGTTIGGTPQQLPREKRALDSIDFALGDAVGRRYVDKYFPASSKRDIQAMVNNIKGALEKRIDAITWMAPATKQEARRKVATMVVGVGYPDRWLDYGGFDVRADDAFGNLDRARLIHYGQQLAKVGRSVDRGEWWMTPQTVNAVNLPLQNALNFPAAILEKPYYDPSADAAANYGAIGATIGHEISHSFDNLGATVDSSGRLRNWWTPQDLAHFKAAGAALAAQYSAYEVLPGLHIKGQQVLGENIADVTGLGAALEAYHASLNGKPAPVIDGLTGDQRFFLAYAQSWREKRREASLRARIATDVHASARWRIFTVRNIDAWYPAFNVKPGQKLYLAPDQRVKVW
jgi:putative endopeptidase